MKRWLGWVGFAIIIILYALSSFSVIAVTSFTYIIGNLLGAALLGYASWQKRAYQPLAIYVVWVILSFIQFFR